MVASQSTAASRQGFPRARGSATTWAAANAMRLNAFLPAVAKSRGALRRNSSNLPPAQGSLMRTVSFSGAFMSGLGLQPENVDPAPRAPRFQCAVDQLQPLCALQQVPFERRVFANVADEKLPFGLERVVVGLVVRNLLPVGAKIVRLTHVRIPYRPGRFGKRLGEAARQARHGRTTRTIHLECHQIIAAHAYGPGTVEMRDDSAREPESRVRGIVGGGAVFAAVFIPAGRDVPRTEAGNPLDFPEQAVEHVAAVAQHIENDSSAVLLAVVPGGPLRGLVIALEHPVAELAPDREYFPEETGVTQRLDLQEPRQPQLVLDDAVPDSRLFRSPIQVERLRERGRDGFLAVDVFLRCEGFLEQDRTEPCRRGVEKNRVVGVPERLIQVGGPALDAVLGSEFPQLFG